MKKTLTSTSLVTRYFSIFLIVGLVSLAGYFLSAKPTSINQIANGSTAQKSAKSFSRLTPTKDTTTITNNSEQATKTNEKSRENVEPEKESIPEPPYNNNPFLGIELDSGAGYAGTDESGNTITKDISKVNNKDGGTTISTLKSTTNPTTGNSFQTTNVVRTNENDRIVTKTTTVTTKVNKGDGTLQVTTTNIVTGSNGNPLTPATTVTEVIRPLARSATDRDVNSDSKTSTSYSDNKQLTNTKSNSVDKPYNESVETSNTLKDKKECESRGRRYIDVAGEGMDDCVDPASPDCGRLGQNINGTCYYPGDRIPLSDRFICDWTHPNNKSAIRYGYNSNNCPEKSSPNLSYVPQTKGDCVGNAGWWDGRTCRVPSITPLPGSNMIVCKGVPGKDGTAPIRTYAYVDTVANCPWARDEIKATCKDVIDPITFLCRPHTEVEKAMLCKQTKQTYDSTSGKCLPPGNTTETTPGLDQEQEKICTNQGKRYSPQARGCTDKESVTKDEKLQNQAFQKDVQSDRKASGKFMDDDVTRSTIQNQMEGSNVDISEPGKEEVKEKVKCRWWLPIWAFNACDKDSAGQSMTPSSEEAGQSQRPDLNINKGDRVRGGLTPYGEEGRQPIVPGLNNGNGTNNDSIPSEPEAPKSLIVQLNEYLRAYLKGLYLDFVGDAPTDVDTTEPQR
ncbi:hypothetical protein KBD75_02925 [Candidatus Woesebacteria bacterium]|nr:hypothetical protein [Candidatus Woesebacteria bacterium]